MLKEQFNLVGKYIWSNALFWLEIKMVTSYFLRLISQYLYQKRNVQTTEDRHSMPQGKSDVS